MSYFNQSFFISENQGGAASSSSSQLMTAPVCGVSTDRGVCGNPIAEGFGVCSFHSKQAVATNVSSIIRRTCPAMKKNGDVCGKTATNPSGFCGYHNTTNREGKCQAYTKTGSPCTYNAKNNGFCDHHKAATEVQPTGEVPVQKTPQKASKKTLTPYIEAKDLPGFVHKTLVEDN